MLSWSGFIWALKAATSWMPIAGRCAIDRAVTSIALPSSRKIWIVSVTTTAFNPPKAV